jgi:thiol-disulfide isomerase/thioredoxin
MQRISSALALLVLVQAVLSAQPPDHPTLPLGSLAPDFKLPGVDGRIYTLNDFAKAKVLAVIFTCNHCPTAQAYEERIKNLVADYRPRGVAFVAINPNHAESVRLDELGYTDLDDSFASMKIRARDRKYNFPYLDDGPTESVTGRFGPAATPHVFIFDAGRKLQFEGRIDDSEREDLVKCSDTRNALDALLDGNNPPVTSTRVFGCSIKWADKAESNREWIEQIQREPVTLEVAGAAGLKALSVEQSGKVRVINVWATWCGPCTAEFDELIRTNLRFRHRDFEMVTVAAQFPEEKKTVLNFLQSHHASTRNVLFGDTDKYRLMEALDPEWSGALPHTLVLGPSCEVLYRQTGEVDFLKLRRAIVTALNAITPWGGLSPK